MYPISSVSLENPNIDTGTETCYCCINKMWKPLWNWVMNRSWKCFNVRARKSLHYHEWTVKRNFREDSERKEERL